MEPNSKVVPCFCALALAFVVLASPRVVGQEVLYHWDGDPRRGSDFGVRLGCVGDVDADGVPDLAIGDPAAPTNNRGIVVIYSGATGAVLHEFLGEQITFKLITAAGVGDIDHDGYGDFLLGAPGAAVNLQSQGAAYLYSGRTSTLLRRHLGQDRSDMGDALTGMGDLDDDGVPDYAIASPDYAIALPSSAGLVEVFSGATGTCLYRIVGESDFHSFGISLRSMADVDGDGKRDFVTRAALHEPDLTRGRVYVFSGADGRRIWSRTGERDRLQLGQSLDILDDRDGDGVEDLLVGVGSGSPELAYLYSGATGAELGRIHEVRPDENFATSVAGVGDVNGDGIEELAIGAPWANQSAGTTYLYCGRTLSLLYEHAHPTSWELFGDRLESCGDLDGDGLGEFLVGAWEHSVSGDRVGGAWAFAGNDLYLQSSDSSPPVGTPLDLDTRGGAPGDPTVLALVEVDDLGTFRILNAGKLDPRGTHRFSTTVPPGLDGHRFGLQSFSLSSRFGRWIDSAVERVAVQ